MNPRSRPVHRCVAGWLVRVDDRRPVKHRLVVLSVKLHEEGFPFLDKLVA